MGERFDWHFLAFSPGYYFSEFRKCGGEVWNGIPFNGPHLSVLPVISMARSFFGCGRTKRFGAGEEVVLSADFVDGSI